MKEQEYGGYHPWRWLIAAYTGFFVNQAVISSYTLFVLPVEDSLGPSHFWAQLPYSMALVAQAVSSPFLGRWQQRVGSRSFFIVGSLLSAAGLLAAAHAKNYWELLAAFMIVGLGVNGFGLVVGAPLVSLAFPRRRGLIVGLLSTATGVAAMIAIPAAAGLLANGGWRLAWSAFGVGTVGVIVPVAWMFLPHGPVEPVGTGPAPVRGSLDGPGVLLVIAFFCTALGSFGSWVLLAPVVTGLKVPFSWVAAAVTMAGMLSGVGRLGFGYLADKMSFVGAGVIGYAVSTAAVVGFILLSPHPDAWALFFVVALFGVSFGGRTPVFSAIAAQRYRERYAEVWGWILLGQGAGGAIGPAVTGAISQAAGGFHAALAVTAGLYLVAASILVWVSRQPLARPSPAAF